jgi:ubiquitin-protein ligase E3 C
MKPEWLTMFSNQ